MGKKMNLGGDMARGGRMAVCVLCWVVVVYVCLLVCLFVWAVVCCFFGSVGIAVVGVRVLVVVVGVLWLWCGSCLVYEFVV